MRTRADRRPLCLEALEDRTVPTAVAVPSGIVSWWTANNTAADAMGLNNATLTGVTYANGEVGKAFSFNGVNDWAALGNPSSLAFTASFSIEGWIKVNGLPTNYNFGSIMFRGDDRAGLDPYSLDLLPDGSLRFEVCGTTGTADLYAPVPIGQFVHVAATLDDATGAMTLYENGAVVAQTVTPFRPFGTLDPTQNPGVGIGNSNYLPNYDVPFNGLIDELSVYNRALTAGEVLGIYKAGSSGKVISPIAVDSPSVVNGADGATTPITFTITRTGSLTGSLTVNWTTADDTATAGTNYVAASGTVTFAAGQATQTVQVTTLNDTAAEPTVDFKLILTPAGGTAIMGLATILTDTTSISVSNATASEGSNTLQLLGQLVSNGSGGLSTARSSIFGPDGNLYVASASTNAILRYSPTGEFINAFVPSGSGGLDSPWDLVFGPDGNLYVSSYGNNEVLCYNGTSGAFLGVVVSGLSSPGGLTFGPDGSLYIANQGTNEVLRYNSSGLSAFVTAGSGGLSEPRRAVFGPDGNLYVASDGSGQILRYNGQTGAFIDVFATTGPTPGPIWLEFGTDGYLYATVRTTSSGSDTSILRFNATTGALVDSFALGRDGWSFNLGPNNVIYDSSNSSGGFIDLIGPSSIAAFTVSLAWASAGTTTISYATADGTALAGSDYLATSGTLSFAPGETTKTFLVPTLDDGVAGPTTDFTVNLSNPTGGGIAIGQGIGTILDDTTFYVVDGGTSNSTYQYASAGAALGNNALGAGDTAPRGVASTAAGTTEWVVDANKNVYVYSTDGALLGSWSASGLSSSAQLTGITTDGTNIWLVDSYSDKVYKYTGAAGLLSGSQTAASSFSLAGGRNGNTNPQDIVTDATSFWVVDGTALKVFKYTLSGSFLGSWSIDPANTHPTGITIDPTNVSNIWIVDKGTDRVYQYTAAASRTSGSQTAAATFALAPGDTNPQGIADPPPHMLLTSAFTPVFQETPAVAAVSGAVSSGMSLVTVLPSLASRDALFARLVWDSLPGPNEFAIDLPTGGAFTAPVGSASPVSDGALTFVGTVAEKPVDYLTPFTPGNGQAVPPTGNAFALFDGDMLDDECQA
jgi:hypothetical protein